MILLVDNYDSFVHNLARYLERLGQTTFVVRNDAIDAERIQHERPAAVVLSPGPRTPSEAGNSLAIAAKLIGKIPLLGVCLGHQTIAAALGGQVVRAPEPFHGRTSRIRHDHSALFQGLPNPLTVCRYHSLVVQRQTLPAMLRETAVTDDGVLMAFEHQDAPVFGVQFHPEAILTESGYPLLSNFLQAAGLVESPPRVPPSEVKQPAARRTPLPDAPVTF